MKLLELQLNSGVPLSHLMRWLTRSVYKICDLGVYHHTLAQAYATATDEVANKDLELQQLRACSTPSGGEGIKAGAHATAELQEQHEQELVHKLAGTGFDLLSGMGG